MLFKVFSPCLFLTALVYGYVYIGIESFFFLPPVGLFLTSVLTLLIYHFRIPAPSKEAVEAILGEDLSKENDDDDSEEKIIMKVAAHRGAALDVPENTLTAFKMCADKNCYFIEFDVSLAKDNVPVVFHDYTLERVADIHRRVTDMTLSELKEVDVSIKHPFRDRYKNCPIPTLEETVLQLLNSNQRMFIDIKENKYIMIDIINELFTKYPVLYTRAIVSSFYPNIIYLVRCRNPKIVCSLAWKPQIFSTVSQTSLIEDNTGRVNKIYKHFISVICDFFNDRLLSRILYYFLGLSVILLHKDVINSKVISEWQSKGIRVVAWTVNHPLEKQYFSRVLKIPYMTDTLTGETTVRFVN